MKLESGKDSAFKKFESPCSQCAKGVTLDKGVVLKGPARRLYKPATTFSELIHLYTQFENDRVAKAFKTLGREIRPDSLLEFLAEKTDLCPHSLITPGSAYLVETISFCDGDMGLNLPGSIEDVSAIFFDALSIIRNARAKVRKEEK